MSEANISDMANSVSTIIEDDGIFARRSSAFKARIQRYQQLEKAQEICINLLQIANKIETPTQKLAQTLCSYRVLRQARDIETDLPIVSPFDRVSYGSPQKLLNEFRVKYQTHHYDVAQESEFALLIEKIESLVSALDEHTSTAWRKYTQVLKAQWEVDQKLFSSLAHQQGQRKVQERYCRLEEQFNRSSRMMPKTKEDYEAVIALHEQLCQEREALKLDVPEEVNLFLKSVAGQGATLDMLTENVLMWLANEDDPTRYRIRRL
ncbi:hypothetical protein [Pantoea brenneri]|jgi:hypothetical protein|uniref:hypothetical protein n=1 Tax=Pantoea brenneri TaxID=472694 RepID=UPI0028A0D380|nr:hypothetical protein [Pantoea brenneri]